jgi:DNA-binding CsgD family transcriptional regulator
MIVTPMQKLQKIFEVPIILPRLINMYPNLTQQEIKAALLIVNDFSENEIPAFMNVSKEEFKATRYRLRKKLGLTKDVDLKLFLESIG